MSMPCRWIYQFMYGYRVLDGKVQWPYLFSVYNMYAIRGVVDAYFQIFLLDFNPQYLFYVCLVLYNSVQVAMHTAL